MMLSPLGILLSHDLQELAVSNAYEVAALVAVLERKGFVTHQEALARIIREHSSRIMRAK